MEENYNYQKMKDFIPEIYTVIVADGAFPAHEIPLYYLKNAKRIICL